MRKKYQKPDVESNDVLEQTSLACYASQQNEWEGACQQFIKDETLFYEGQCQSYTLEGRACPTTVLS